MKITNAFVDKPCTIIFLGYFILIILTIIAMMCKLFDMDPVTDREYLVWDDPRTVSWDK
jgi:hypothetical protein